MEARETRKSDRDGAIAPEIEPSGPPASPRPPILRPEVHSPRADSLLGALGHGLPDIVRRARGFYERHPTLVKTVGTVLLAAMTRRLYRGRRGGWF
jgi:hypothetical protein